MNSDAVAVPDNNKSYSIFRITAYTPTLLGHLERADLNHWRPCFRKVVNSRLWTKPRHLVILSVINHRHNPLDSNYGILSDHHMLLPGNDHVVYLRQRSNK
jgi:hypothetical protein